MDADAPSVLVHVSTADKVTRSPTKSKLPTSAEFAEEGAMLHTGAPLASPAPSMHTVYTSTGAVTPFTPRVVRQGANVTRTLPGDVCCRSKGQT